ncbi:MAG TPA: DUF3467 domain-containing protein [Candidatus Saccharibacteria bacterium]|nr:DUF3467 domain-containing protein [Candidatus Saccharibacteria bacterium]
MNIEKQPFQDFGKRLKLLRLKAKGTVDDLSGAVEVDVSYIHDIEAGKTQPSEDIVSLLINHFSLDKQEAAKVWKLAGYKETASLKRNKVLVHTAFISAADIKVLYTDMVNVNANRYGLIMDFFQGFGSDNQSIAISRIGMSREHAKNLVKILQKTLESSEDPKSKKDKKTS